MLKNKTYFWTGIALLVVLGLMGIRHLRAQTPNLDRDSSGPSDVSSQTMPVKATIAINYNPSAADDLLDNPTSTPSQQINGSHSISLPHPITPVGLPVASMPMGEGPTASSTQLTAPTPMLLSQ